MATTRVYSYCRLVETISIIKEKLNEVQLKKFEASIFGKFLKIKEMQFSGYVVHHILKVCVCNEEEDLEFKFGGPVGKKFSLQEFECITGLPCGSVPTREVVDSTRMADTYFGGGGRVKNLALINIFKNAKCTDDDPADDDRVKLALLLFLETVLLSKENNSYVPIEHMKLVDDLSYFESYPWGVVSFTSTVESLRRALGNKSHTYTLTGFPIAFMIWAYENIPSLASTYGNKVEEFNTTRILNWNIIKIPKYENLKNIFLGGIYGDMLPQDGDNAHSGGQKKKRKHNEVAKDAGKRARHAGIPASATHQPSSSASRVVVDEGSSMEDKFSRVEGEMVKLRRQVTSLESKIDLMMSFLLRQSQPGVQFDNDNLRQRDDASQGQDDSHRPEDGFGGLDDNTTEMGTGVGTFGKRDGDFTPTEDVPSDVPSSLSPLLWPLNGNLTLEWIENLMQTFERSSRILTPSDFPSILPHDVFNSLVQCANEILKNEPICFDIDPCGLESSVVVVGDLHGQLHDFLFLLRDAGFPSQDQIFIFNGDFIDRGAWGLETFVILLACKVYMPHKVYLHRGNHESEYCSKKYGFEKEVFIKYGKEGLTVYQSCIACFKNLPLASIVAGRVFIAHGGLFRSVSRMRKKKSKGKKKSKSENETSLTLGCVNDLLKVQRDDSDVILEDILWSDPTMECGLKLNEDRNLGLQWGPDCTEEFLRRNNLKLIIRSHESPDDRRDESSTLPRMDEGFSIDHEVDSGKLVTVFSAPDYPQFQKSEHRYKDKGAYVVLKSPNFDDPEFHSFEAVPRPPADPFYVSDDDK